MSGKKSNHQQQSSSTKSQELVNVTKKKKNHHLFSGKQKKVQLKEERLKKANKHKNEEIIKSNDPYRSSGSSCRGDLNYIEGYENHEKDNNTRIYQSSHTMLTDSIPLCHKSTTEHKHTVLYHHNRHHMNFDQVIEERRALGKQPIIKLPIDSQSEYINDESRLHCPILTIPIRPLGYEGLTKEQLIQREDIYFQHYLKELLETYAFDNLSKNYNNCSDDNNDTSIKYELNNFELNLNVWRQLWRVIERSDIILILADARYPQYTIPLGLINYLQMMIKKPCIIILTKIDLVPNDYITSWLEWYHRHYPSLKLIPYSSHPSDEMLSRVTAELKVDDDVKYRDNDKDGEDDVDSGDDNNHNDESDSDNDNADESDESMNEHDDIHSNSFIRNKHNPITINISDVEPTHRLAMKRGKTRQLVGRRWIAPYGADELLVLIKKELLIHHRIQHHHDHYEKDVNSDSDDDDVNSNRCDERDDSDGNSCNVAGNSHDSMMEERINRISFLPSHILPTLKPSRHRTDDKTIDNCDDIRDNDYDDDDDDDDDNQDDDDDDNENERTNVIDPKSYNKINHNKIDSNEGIRFKQKKQSKYKFSSYYSHKQGNTTKDNHVKILPQVANQVPQYITIGVVGCPNAGKSSFINSLSRKKVVSASKTPGIIRMMLMMVMI